MHKSNDRVRLSPTDLTNYLNCQHLTSLDVTAVTTDLERPKKYTAVTEALHEKGLAHERAYLDHLHTLHSHIIELPEHASLETSLEAMRSGADVIFQPRLSEGDWSGYADFLVKVDTPSNLGDWSYEPQDTKLARETKAGTILQLCVYAALLEKLQGVMPTHIHVVSPGRDWQPETHRVDDYAAYFRLQHDGLEKFIAQPQDTYPEPVSHCDFCVWWDQCEHRRRTDDHLSYIAGISSAQIESLRAAGINTLTHFAETEELAKPDHGSLETLVRAQEQARIQLQGKRENANLHQLKSPFDAEHGFQLLPAPTADDIYLDFEGSHWAEKGVQEYLTGWVTANTDDSYNYTGLWADTLGDEQRAYETFIDTVMAARAANPNMHVYHFAPYEPAALKRLMGRFATRERELDILLSSHVFVDLHSIVRRSLIASVESYSIKELERFFGYERSQDLREAGNSRRIIETALELGPLDDDMATHRQIVTDYNREDCESTHRLQVWLEKLRAGAVTEHGEIARIVAESEVHEPKELDVELQALRDALIADIPTEPADRSPEQQARFLLGHMMEFHRREDKAVWWEYFRLRELMPEELTGERKAVTGLRFVEIVEDKAAPVIRYAFNPQDVDARDSEDVFDADGNRIGGVASVDHHANTIDIKHMGKTKEERPANVYFHSHINIDVVRKSLMRLGEHVINNDLQVADPYRAALKLLLGTPPKALQTTPDPDSVTHACNTALQLDGDVLALQGPPGTGKTYTGGQMIFALVKAGLKVGVVAVSHKVIHNLLEKVAETATKANQTLRIAHRPGSNGRYEGAATIENIDKYDKLLEALDARELQVLGGTQWMWAKEEFAQSVDVLVVDEAGQMALANVLASAPAAKNLILLGDPQQLEQPIQCSHPEGSDVAALKHWLGEHDVMPAERGLFLAETWRLHPEICAFTSKVYYEDKLNAKDDLINQTIINANGPEGFGLRYLPVPHQGNSARSQEEVEAIATLVEQLVSDGAQWTDKSQDTQPITFNDLLIVAPYNSQVAALKTRLPQLAERIGTVDKFQGQEAAVVIYSMTSSSPQDAPRGMEFLYNPNRFNVATSRAKALCILVGEPRLMEPQCKTPAQMRMANGFCWFGEMAVPKS